MPDSERLEVLITAVAEAAARSCDQVDQPLEDLIIALKGPLPLDECRRLLNSLRASRCFTAMARAADELIQAGAGYPYVQRQYAQALIENGQISLASQVLRSLVEDLSSLDKVEQSEALGLLGRAHKQQFVRWSRDPERAARELNEAVRWYQKAYPLDPAWHGANLVALSRRAEREGIQVISGRNSKEVAQTLLRELKRTPESAWEPWTHASAGEASLALENWDDAQRYYGGFARHDRTDGFAVASATRQLREIWGFEAGGVDPPARILAALQTLTLSTASGGEFASTPRELAQLADTLQNATENEIENTLEAVLGENRTIPIEVALKLIEFGASVCQVVDRELHALNMKSGGTGFLVDGKALREEWAGRALLITNHHVLSSDGDFPSIQASLADAIFHYWEGKPQPRTFEVKQILEHSDRNRLDFSIAELQPDPDLHWALSGFSTDRHALAAVGSEPPSKVYVIGHPDGRGLEFSLSDNVVVDHQLRDAEPLPCRCIHYRAPTEKGMSGSPVLNQRFEVIGLHRKGGKVSRLRKAESPTEYRANEAVWGKSILDALRGAGLHGG